MATSSSPGTASARTPRATASSRAAPRAPALPVDLLSCTRCDATSIEDYIDSVLALLGIDDDDDIELLADGVLVLRFLFGFTGTTLTNGAVDTENCVLRCEAAAIEPYLQTLI